MIYDKIKEVINDTITGNDKKLLIAVGPCSIHNIGSTKIFIKIIKKIQIKFKKFIIIIFRIYLEKPRTITGWKGYIYDPNINNSFEIKKGIINSIKILKLFKKKYIPTITEFLNENIAQIIKKYITIGTIGARTCESQPHRELISYLNIPCGIKNTTDGNIEKAINTILTTKTNNIFIKKSNKIRIIKTIKNNKNFIILRGGMKPNYYKKDFIKTKKLLKLNNIKTGIMIDCSHDNSKKICHNQKKIVKYIIKHYKFYTNLMGIMIETHLYKGTQKINKKISKYKSITDSCTSFKKVYYLIKKLYQTKLSYYMITK